MFFRVFFVSCLVFINAQASPVRSCEDGEQFWCRSVKNANLCKQFDHCLAKVWVKQQVKTGCMSGRKAVEQIQNNEAETACDVLTPKYQARCAEVIKSNGEEIARMTGMELHPRNIAKLLGLCSTLKDPRVCSECKAFADDLKLVFMGKGPENHFKQYFRNVCGNFGVLESPCLNVTMDWVGNLFEAIKYKMPFEILCEWLKFCDDGADNVKKNQMLLQGMKYFYGLYLEGPSSKSCKSCKSLVSHIRDILQRQDLQETTGDYAASEGCLLVPPELEKQCKKIVTQNTLFIFEVIIDEMSEDYICESVDMCPRLVEKPSTVALLRSRVENFASSALNTYLSELKTSLVSFKTQMKTSVGEKLASIKSKVEARKTARKEKVARYMLEAENKMKEVTILLKTVSLFWNEQLMEFNARLQGFKQKCLALKEKIAHPIRTITTFADNVYDETMKSVQDLKQSVTFFFETLAKNLENELAKELESFYTRLDNYIVNHNNKAKNELTTFKAVLSTQSSVNVTVASSGECKFCAVLTKQMLGMLASKRTQDSILESVNEVCDHLPDPLGGQCKSIVKTEGRQLLQEILDILDPTLVCEAMGFCLNDRKLEARVQLNTDMTRVMNQVIVKYQGGSADGDSAWCTICKTVVGVVHDDFDDIERSTGLSIWSQEMCGFLEKPEKIEGCITSARRVEIITLEILKVMWSPDFACDSIGVCDRAPVSTVLQFKPEK